MLYDAVTGDFQGSIFMPTSPRRYYINFQHQMVGANDRLDFVLWDLTTGKSARLPGYNGVNEMAISPDGRRLVLGKSFPSSSGGFESELTLLSLKAGRRLLAFSRQGRVTDVSFSPDGNRLVAAFSPSGPAPPSNPSKSGTPRRCRKSRKPSDRRTNPCFAQSSSPRPLGEQRCKLIIHCYPACNAPPRPQVSH